MLFISYICCGGSYPRPKGRELATANLSSISLMLASVSKNARGNGM